MMDAVALAAAIEPALGGSVLSGRTIAPVPQAERIAFACGEPPSPALQKRIDHAYALAPLTLQGALSLEGFVAEVRAEAAFRLANGKARPAEVLGRCEACGRERK